MSQPELTREEIARRGTELYEQQIRDRVETSENIGKIIAIDLESQYPPDANKIDSINTKVRNGFIFFLEN
ncbi:MAG: hypothetical protein MUD14_14030 [Hydrococcus sp. Prado102]|nr:hypothetical protein [Hydrococcus sp. Prado102]